jgi:uncharacterized phage-associated protein
MAIVFEYRPEKFASAAAYLAKHKRVVTKKEICQLLYFADKRHLLRYGRTITGDQYRALEQGPIPTLGLDALNEKGDAASIDAVRKYGQLHGCTFELQRDPDLKLLSKSDVRILDEVLADLGSLHAWQLEDLSHKEPCWIKAGRNEPMDFIDFFEGHPEAEQIKLAEVS